MADMIIPALSASATDGLSAPSRWCILRMSSASTLRVVTSLTESGFTVWTPSMEQTRLVGPARNRQRVTLPVALMAGIAFADADRLDELLAASRAPSFIYQRWNPETRRMETHGCPHFTVFRYYGGYPTVDDRHLDALRIEEQRARPAPKAPAWKKGDEVRCPTAGFDGLIGRIEQVRGKLAFVVFGEMSFPVQIDRRHLLAAKSGA